jgi:molybdopterin-guanine dinucleotide biosynthesis protein A
MGTDKATLVVDGVALAVRAGRVLAEVCAPVIEAGPGVSELAAVQEDPPGSGPLAAFLVAVEHLGHAGPVLLLACDLPRVDAAFLRELAAYPGTGSVVPVVEGRPQYACARWSPRAIAAARDAFANGARALQALDTVDREPFAVPNTQLLADVDTPEDLRRLGLS